MFRRAADNNSFIANSTGFITAVDTTARLVLIDIHGHNVLDDSYIQPIFILQTESKCSLDSAKVCPADCDFYGQTAISRDAK